MMEAVMAAMVTAVAVTVVVVHSAWAGAVWWSVLL
jgi:hypothetical protein